MTTHATTRIIDIDSTGTYIINHVMRDNPDIRHRDGGPARISVYPNDNNDHLIIIWYNHGTGERRLDGPDITLSDGTIQWHPKNNNITQVSEPRGHES